MADIIKFIKQMTSISSNSNIMEGKRQVVTRLKFIASISPHEKIDSQNLKVESASLWTPLRRFFYGDSRSSTLTFFSSTIDRAFEVIDAHIHSKAMSDRLFCANIITDLMGAVNGLKAFQKTYEDDKLISCEISVIIESIEAKVYSIKETHPDMFTIKKEFMAQMAKQQKDEEKLNFNHTEPVDKQQSYHINSGPLPSTKTESHPITIKSNWKGEKTVFDPSLDDIDEEHQE